MAPSEPPARKPTHRAIRRARGAAKKAKESARDGSAASADEAEPTSPGAKYKAAVASESAAGDDASGQQLCTRDDSVTSEMGAPTAVGDAASSKV